MSFGQALEAVKNGKTAQRVGWNGKGMWIALQKPDAQSKIGVPYLYMKGVDGKLFPWNPNNLDMLAEDWQIVS